MQNEQVCLHNCITSIQSLPCSLCGREGHYLWEDHGYLSTTNNSAGDELTILYSACDDHQISLDTTALSGDIVTGAMTHSFVQAVENEQGLTYGRLLNAMRHKIRNAAAEIELNDPLSSFVWKFQLTEFSQVLQLSVF